MAGLAPARPVVGFTLRLTDAELVTLAVIQALRGFTPDRRFLRFADRHLRHMFPFLPTGRGRYWSRT